MPTAKSYERRSVRRGMRDPVKPRKTLRRLSPVRAVLTAVSALAAVLVLAAYLVAPPVERVSAQDGGTATAAGNLVVVPGVVEMGQTTLAVGFHVVPMDLEVVIEYSEHFTPEGESCDNAGTAGATQAAPAPVWITLNACTVGDGNVRLVESATGNIIKDVSVTVTEPVATGQQGRISVSISDLTSTELVPGGSGDRFSVSVTGLEAHREHNLHTVVLNSLSAAFNRGCTRFGESASIVGQTSTTANYTVYGCVAPGNRVWSYVEDVGGTSLASTSILENEVNVADPKVSFKEPAYDVDEEDEVTVTVELTHRSSHVIRIPITVSNGTDRTVMFSRLTTSTTFPYTASQDPDCDDETVSLRFGALPSSVSGTGSPSTATVNIEDDDVCARFGERSYDVDEGSSVRVEVELSRAPGRTVRIPVAVRGEDDRTLTFGRNTTSRTFTYRPPDDTNCDDETVELSFGTLPSGVIEGSPDESEISVEDDDVCASFGERSYDVDEGSSLTVEVELSRAPGRSIRIPVTVDPGTNRNLTFGRNTTSRTFTYTPGPDDDCENGTVELGFGSLPSGVVAVAPDEAEISVEDDDVCASFDDSEYSVDEGSSVTVEVELSRAPGRTVTIPVTVDPGTNRNLTFRRNTTSRTFRYTASQNNDDLTVDLSFGSLPSGVVEGTPSRAILTIEETNVPPTFNEGPRTTRSVAENTPSGADVGSPVTARDDDNDRLTYSLSSTDANSTDARKFRIGEFSGQIRTFDSLNFETRNSYSVIVTADDRRGGSDSIDVTITVTNLHPTIAPSSSPVNYDEGETAPVATYRASDPGGGAITWSLLGTDQTDFNISGGILRFNRSPDYESPHDSNRDNDYEITVVASDGDLTATRNVTIRVVNLPPTRPSGSSSVNYDEGGRISVEDYDSSDPGGGTITWSLGGTDGNAFRISGSGVLTFKSPPDFENPVDSGGNIEYSITVIASDTDDGSGLSAERNVTVTVMNLAPTITQGSASPRYAEGGTGPVATYVASDPGGGAISWSIPAKSVGTDKQDFEITRQGGVLTFKNTPDYEAPHDSDGDNDYTFKVRASDASGSMHDLDVTVSVTNVNERPVADLAITDQTMTVGVSRILSLQGTFSDPDANDTLTYSASTSPSGIATASVNNSDSTLTLAALSAGSATITVTAADRAASDADRMEASQAFTVTVEPNAPAKVTGLTGTPGSVRGTIDLNWDPADRADDYEVAQWKRRLGPIFHWVVLDVTEATIDVADSSAVISGLVGGETYRHRVRGIRGTGSNRVEGSWSDELDTTLTLPAKVTGLSGMPGTNSREIKLEWDAAGDVTDYQLRQREHHIFPLPDDWDVLDPGEFVTDTEATVTGLDPEKTYVYQVRSTNVHGVGEWSDATPHIAVLPDTPTGLISQYTVGHRGVSLHWRAAAGAAEYEVEISRAGSSQRIDVSDEWVELTRLIPRTVYSFKVRSWHTNDGNRRYSPGSVAVDETAPEPAHWWGHQADHKVEYVKGNIGNSVIEDRIAPAVSEWKSELASLGMGLDICTGTGCVNPDGFTVTIKTVDNKNDSIATATKDPLEGCGTSRACVKPVGPGGGNASAAPGLHMENMFMIFEDPPWYAERMPPRTGRWVRTQYVWTKDKNKNMQPVPCVGAAAMSCAMMPTRYYVYVDRIMVHEFGHTLGLPDFNEDNTGLKSMSDAVMHTAFDIHDDDIDQLRAIYLPHNPH